ncbi:hypothetical protein RIF29_28194 [Crotalaria pallida]|uniref:Uncharacterized protein n=1 Tax=Crotalaria pallida TaxID=3830 RepID=A0AAN9ESU3_CROPI
MTGEKKGGLHQQNSICHTMNMFKHEMKRKDAYMLFSLHSVAAAAAIRLVSAAWNVPVVAVPRFSINFPNFQFENMSNLCFIINVVRNGDDDSF